MDESIIEPYVVRKLSEIPELTEKIYPIFAPKDTQPPFLVYISTGAEEDETLDGFIGSYETQMEINILHNSYEALKYLTVKVERCIKSIQDFCITINPLPDERFEQEIKAYRKVIIIKIMH